MKPTNRDRVFVADFPAEGAGLGEANMMGFARHPTARHRAVWRRTCSAPCRAGEWSSPQRGDGAGQRSRAGRSELRRRRPSERRKDFQPERWFLPPAPTAGLPDQRLKPPRSRPACRENRLRPCPRRRRSACSWPKGCCGPSAQPHRRFASRRGRRATAPAASPIGLAPEGSAKGARAHRCGGARRRLVVAFPLSPERAAVAPLCRSCWPHRLCKPLPLAPFGKIRRVEVVLSRDAHKGEEGITARVGERSSHPTRRRRLGDRADWPFRRQPLA
jgi:hypothetical protein